ncbi:Mitochondrial carrier [Holotrichia oblita]|uniref:Mitochondrial carrier n=1 Tax=Holotrichia oblita TaxID=644536 RepID=A0ACB9T3B6_HOLOL|nr:Mitochondrial carrier [Holotrichia oblita]
MEFLLGGVAAMGATLFTNPLEVIKTRMQLQGELRARSKYVVQYKNFLHGGYTIAKHDGILALQAGLVPGLWFQLLLNGFRLGAYDIIDSLGLIRSADGHLIFHKSILASAATGVGGSLLGSPFYLVKTHIQAQSAKEIAFGHQHNHEGMMKGFVNIYKEHGIKGLFRGSVSQIPRASVGSAAQLTSFEYAKQWLKKNGYFEQSVVLQLFVASMIGGINVTLMMTPFDLVATRLYNQGGYDYVCRKGYTKNEKGETVFYKSVLAGGLAGNVGAFIASPFFLVKTHLQGQAAEQIAFGYQHHHSSMWSAFKKIFREHGIRGLYRGSTSAIPRSFLGSTAQLTTFTYSKELSQKYKLFSNYPLLETFAASMVSGIFLSVMITPFDLVCIRLYNQAKILLQSQIQTHHNRSDFFCEYRESSGSIE